MRKQSKLNKTYAVKDGQEVIYNDIRDSQMVDNGSATSTRVYNLHPNLNGVITPVETKKPSNQARIPFTRSKALGPEGYAGDLIITTTSISRAERICLHIQT